jgi:predicted DNA binding protein
MTPAAKGVREGPPLTAECTIQLPISPATGCIYGVSMNFPRALFEVQRYFHWNRQLLSVVHVTGGARAEEVLSFLRQAPEVHEAELLYVRAGGFVLWMRCDTTERSVAQVANSLGLLPHFPIRVQNGVLRMSIIAPPVQLRRFYLAVRRRSGGGARIVSMRPIASNGGTGLLTRRQQEVFRTALGEGYWDHPRRVTMAGLASHLDISKSAVAETLAQIEMKLMRFASRGTPLTAESGADRRQYLTPLPGGRPKSAVSRRGSGS